MSENIFIHGLESSNQGTKSVFFRELFPDMIIPNFTGELEERMEKLERILTDRQGIKIVGSSFGGLMGTLFAMENSHRINKLILLAPAINYLESVGGGDNPISLPVLIYHGKDDQVIPLREIEPIAGKIFKNLTFHAVKDDHFLHSTFKTIDWHTLLA